MFVGNIKKLALDLRPGDLLGVVLPTNDYDFIRELQKLAHPAHFEFSKKRYDYMLIISVNVIDKHIVAIQYYSTQDSKIYDDEYYGDTPINLIASEKNVRLLKAINKVLQR